MTATTRRSAETARRIAVGTFVAAVAAGGLVGAGTDTSRAASPTAPPPAASSVPSSASVPTPALFSPSRFSGPWLPAQRVLQAGAGQPAAWVSPLAGKYPVSEKYGIRGDWAAGHHTGVDLAAPSGTPVRSVGSGRVVFAGDAGDYGKTVTIRMSDGTYTLFAHLSRITVQQGASVRAGSPIARSGNTGRSSGPHLHFEVRTQRDYGSDIDPVAHLARRGVHIP